MHHLSKCDANRYISLGTNYLSITHYATPPRSFFLCVWVHHHCISTGTINTVLTPGETFILAERRRQPSSAPHVAAGHRQQGLTLRFKSAVCVQMRLWLLGGWITPARGGSTAWWDQGVLRRGRERLKWKVVSKVCVCLCTDRLMCTLAQRVAGQQQVGLESFPKSPQVRSRRRTARAQPVLRDVVGKCGGNLPRSFVLLKSILECRKQARIWMLSEQGLINKPWHIFLSRLRWGCDSCDALFYEQSG